MSRACNADVATLNRLRRLLNSAYSSLSERCIPELHWAWLNSGALARSAQLPNPMVVVGSPEGCKHSSGKAGWEGTRTGLERDPPMDPPGAPQDTPLGAPRRAPPGSAPPGGGPPRGARAGPGRDPDFGPPLGPPGTAWEGTLDCTVWGSVPSRLIDFWAPPGGVPPYPPGNPPGAPGTPENIRTKHLSRLGELLNTKKNVHFFRPRVGGGAWPAPSPPPLVASLWQVPLRAPPGTPPGTPPLGPPLWGYPLGRPR